MSLRWKIAAALAALAGAIAAASAAGAYVTASRQLERSVDDALVSQALSTVERSMSRGPGRPGLPGPPVGTPRCPEGADLRSLHTAQLIIEGEAIACVDDGDISVTDRDLAIAAGASDDGATSGDGTTGERTLDDDDGYQQDGDEAHIDAGLRRVEYVLRTERIHGEPTRVITMGFPSGGAIQLARSLDEAAGVLDGLRIRLALIAAAGIAAAALVGFVLATRIVAPIRRLTSTAEHVARTRDLSTPVPAGGKDEIGSLATSFTSMMGSLAESQDQQQRLVSDASHEMRTPLTSLQTNLDLLARAERAASGSLSPDERRDVIDDLRFEVGELTALLTELVDLATDQGGATEAAEPLDLVELARNVAERHERRSGRTIEVAAPDEPLGLTGRPHALERAVSNLVENAIKYSPDGGPIEVSVGAAGGRPRLAVRDHGPGIAPEDRPRVFDRFYRATTARTHPGSGLGLAIVAQVVEAHGGEVFVEDGPGGGAIVGFVLPPSTRP